MSGKPSKTTQKPLDDEARARVTLWAREHWDAVFGMLYRLTYRRQEAEDLTQETFLRAAARHETFVPGTNLRAWLMRIALNARLDLRRRQTVTTVEPLHDDLAASDVRVQDQLAGRELAEALEDSLSRLPETARIVFLLRTREELSFREIGEAIETTEETARWHMLQARRQLMTQLKPRL